MAQHDAASHGGSTAGAPPPPVHQSLEQSNDFIAEQFVKHYYGALQNKPFQLHLFYKEHSMYTLHLPGGNCPNARGGVDIKNRINEALDGSCEVKQLSWSHQVSLDGSLVLSVCGELVNTKNSSVRRFAQTIVLACENGVRNSFYIHNDICCFFDVAQAPLSPQLTPQPVEAAKEPAPEAAVSGSPSFGALPADEPALDDFKPPAPAVHDKPAPEPEPEPEPPAKAELAAEVQPEESSAKQDQPKATEFKPSSWAGITALKCPKPVEPEKQPPRRPGPPGSGVAKSADANTTEQPAKEEDPASKEDPSVFVSGVPHGCEKEHLDGVMSQFGSVKKIVIRSDKHYAIVDFVDSDSATKALEAPAPSFDGSILKIEKRREQETRGKGRGRGEGRGSGGRGRGQANGGYTTVGSGKDSGNSGKGARSKSKKPQE